MQIEVSGIPVEIVKKDIKTLRLAVLPPDGAVRVSAPRFLSDNSIRRFVQDRTDWILKQRARFAARPKPFRRQYISGEPLHVWGREYLLQVVEHTERERSLILAEGQALLSLRQGDTLQQRASFVKEWYRAQLKAEAEKRLPLWESCTGLSCRSWQTKYMTTRWGTCNPAAGRLWLNLQLAQRPVECLDYVLLHELAHLRIPNHGPAFQALLGQHMPQWQEVRRQLNTFAASPMLPVE